MKKALVLALLVAAVAWGVEVASVGVWAWGSTVRSVGVDNFIDEIHSNGITDVFLLVKGVDGSYTFNTLDSLIDARNARGYTLPRIHAWVICFNDQSWGGWVDPENTSYRNYLLGTIFSPLIREHDIDGVNLDCIRYPGTASGNTAPITSFCQAVRETIEAAGKGDRIIYSAAVMPEMSSNASLYGQDYGDMAQYLDVLLPMSYTHNYYSSPRWVGSTVRYIVDEINSETDGHCQVWVALQSKDDNGVFASAQELWASIVHSLNAGATGFNYFVYPITGEQYSLISLFTGDTSFVPDTSDTSSPSDTTTPPDTIPPPSDSCLSYDDAVTVCVNVANWIESNQRAPAYASSPIGNLTMDQVFYLCASLTADLCADSTRPYYCLHFPNSLPSGPFGDVYAGVCTTYAAMAQNAKAFVDSNNTCPNYVTSELGRVRFWEALYMFARVVRWYHDHGSDPGSAYIRPVPGFITDAYSSYTGDTWHCPASDPDIRTQAMQIIENISNQANSGSLSNDDAMYQAAEAIHYWVSGNKTYCFYYDTRYGAYDAIFNYSCLNCVDHAHAVVALARAVGIPARYRHATCWFGSSTYGHVWAYLYINSTSYHTGSDGSAGWWDADASMDLDFGDHKPIYSNHGTYYELPFLFRMANPAPPDVVNISDEDPCTTE